MAPRVIVKNDGSKEPYDEGKLLAGLYSACKKRPISKAKIQELMEEIESAISKYKSDEIPSMFIGERVMKGLAALDEVAYMRFASVYQNFKEVSEFVTAVDGIPSPKETLR
jgi:transcriptional repressor NrdR